MKTSKLIGLAITLVVAGLVSYNYKFLKRYYYLYFKTDEMFVMADRDSFDKGPSVGEQIPAINALGNNEVITSLNQYLGNRGMVLVINRSLEWCPYCMRQTIELQKLKKSFDVQGISIVMMTYDTPELQKTFIDRHGIEYPVLSDIDAESFKNLGVLREEYGPDHKHYGLPYPGMLVISPDGVIKGKLFIEAYSSRVDSKEVLKLAEDWLGP